MNRSALYADNHTYKYAMLEAKQLTPAPYNDTIIVVIGESETRTLMNAFNPDHVPNTPWLTSEKSNPNFTLFNNVYACVWYTVPVLEHALTESNFITTKSSISLFLSLTWQKSRLQNVLVQQSRFCRCGRYTYYPCR